MAVRTVVVEDNWDLAFLLCTWLELDERLELAGTATNGIEGIEVCAREQPDVVIVDVQMPELDGVAAIPLIREASPHTRIVVFSSDPTARDAALAAGAHAWHTKTDPIARVLDTVAGDR